MIDSSEEERRSLIPALFAMADWIEVPVPRHSPHLPATNNGPAIIGLAKPRGLGVFLGAEPAIRLCDGGVIPAHLQVINPDVTCQARAPGEFCLDAAAGRHRGFVRKQGLAQLAVLVASAGRAQQSARLFVMAEILRGDKAASPKTAQLVVCVRLVLLEPTLGVGLKVQRKTPTHQQLVQTGGFAVDGAKPDMPFAVDFARPQILAVNTALINQFRKLVARFHAARPGFGMFVDAHLVELRSIDAIEFESHAAELDGVSVLDERVLGASRTCCEKYQDHDQKTHRLNQPAKMMISPDLIA